MYYLLMTRRVLNPVLVWRDNLLLVSSGEGEDRKQPENDGKKDGKWHEGGKTNTEYDLYDIPLVKVS